jgi:ribosome-associated toxin RatA of RatAB toxin-antitoxin module
MENPHNPKLPYFTCERFEPDFYQTATARFVNVVTLPVSPQRLFEIFEDADSWTKWVPGIQNVEWTSPQPYGVGTTRTVFFTGGMEVYEDFTAWNPGEEMAFQFTGTSQEVWSQFGEHYAVEDLGNGSCRLTWTVAYEPAGTFKKIHFLVKPAMKIAFKLFMKKLRKFCEKEVRAGVPANAGV